MNDEVTELADLWLAQYHRGEDLDHLEFRLRWAALTDEERDDFLALLDQQRAHGEEQLEGLREDNRVLLALRDLVESSGAPPGTTLWEAGEAGYVGVMEVVESIRAVPDPLAQ